MTAQRIEHLAEGVTLYLGDCREILGDVRAARALISDPPYGNANHDGDFNARLNDYRGIENKPIANDGADEMRDVVDAVLTHAARFLDREASACCCFCGGGGPRPVFAWLAERMDRDGLQFFHSVIWDKRNPGLGQRYRRQHEMMMVAHRKGGRISWNDDGRLVPNVFSRMPSRDREHPNEKPLDVMERIVETHTNRGDLVVDPFMGSGTTGVAAIKLGRKFTGIEIEPKYFDIACRRVGEELKRPRLFVDPPKPAKQEALEL